MDLRRIDLNLLVTLDVLLREPGVTQAARRLHLSQPAVSARLQRLRELFGDPLFVANGRGLTPTPLAREVAPRLQRLLAELGGILRAGAGFDPATAARTFRIAATDDFHAAVSARLLALMQREAPGCRLAMLTPGPDRLEGMLLDGEVDLLLGIPYFIPQGAAYETLYLEDFLCVFRPAHPLLGRALDLDAYCGLPHLLVSPLSGDFYGHVDDELSALDRTRRVVASVASFLLVPEVLARTDLVCTVPARLARMWERAGRVAVAEPPLEVAGFALQLGWSPAADGDQGLSWLRGRLRSLCGDPVAATESPAARV